MTSTRYILRKRASSQPGEHPQFPQTLIDHPIQRRSVADLDEPALRARGTAPPEDDGEPTRMWFGTRPETDVSVVTARRPSTTSSLSLPRQSTGTPMPSTRAVAPQPARGLARPARMPLAVPPRPPVAFSSTWRGATYLPLTRWQRLLAWLGLGH